MNLWAMVTLAATVAIEKYRVSGEAFVRAVGVTALVTARVAAVVASWLPGLAPGLQPMDMAMSMAGT
jgi:hypothetical protein